MKHPDQATLALQAGGDLGWFRGWLTARHVAKCGQCSDEVSAFEEVRRILPELSGMPGEMPEAMWDRMAADMRANIRLGLAAGECVRSTEAPARESPLFKGARMALAMGSVMALLVAALVLEHPVPSAFSAGVPMVENKSDRVQRVAGEQGFALTHKDTKYVTYSAGSEGTMGASFVDPSTNFSVTMTKVYVE